MRQAAVHSPAPAPAVGSLWRHPDFRKYWGGQALTVAGFGITTIGTSVIAVVDLHASTMNVALIAVAGKVPPLLLSLHAGVLADRYRKRPIIIGCDVLCAVTLTTVPVAQMFAGVTLTQLYAVAFLVSAFQVIGGNASISYLPTLLRGDQLKEGNAKLGATNSLADLAGNNLGGLLVTLLGAARAIALDAVSYLVCAFCLLRVRHREPEPVRRPAGTGQWPEIREGLDYTLRAPLVRSIVLTNATTSFALAASSALWSLYLLRELLWSPAALGVVMGAGGIGGFIGAMLWRPVERRRGAGPVMLTALAVHPVAQIPLLVVGPGIAGQLAIGAGLLIQTCAAVAHGGLQRSVRQELCPDHLQGRAQATGSWLAYGLRPLAALLAGTLGTLVGLRPTLGVITCLLCVPFVILWCSPVRSLRTVVASTPAAVRSPARIRVLPTKGTAVPPSSSEIRDLIDTYLERHPAEKKQLVPLLALFDSGAEPTSRTTLPAHITCSAVVIDHERRVLHISDRASGKPLAPGGHVEEDRSLLSAALRELREETGIRPGDLCLTAQFLHTPADIDVHDIDADPVKGEPAHRHFDFRFAFHLVHEQPPPLTLRDDEVSGAQWLPLTDVGSPALRAKLLDAEARGLGGQPEPVNASAMIHDGHGRYLLHLRDQREGIWEPGVFALIGGGREHGDACLEATVRRELAEETPGLDVADLTPYAVEEATSVEGLVVPIQVYTGRWSGHPDTADLQEGVLLQWFTPDMLDRLRQSPGLGDLVRRHAAEHPAADGRARTLRPLREEAPAGTELHIVGVHLYLQDEHGRILLGLRHPDSAFAPDEWHFLAGHCEREEAVSCLVREAWEEAGLRVEPDDVELAHLVHLVDSPSARPRIGLVFRARSWSGTPEVLEPDRCVEWRWWHPKDLPAEVVPYTRQAIDGILAGRLYSERGWAGDEHAQEPSHGRA